MSNNGKPHQWEIDNNESVILTWDDADSIKQLMQAQKNNQKIPYVPYEDYFLHTSRTIRWRGETLHIAVSEGPRDQGSEKRILYRYKDKIYVTRFAKWKMWGSTEIKEPDVLTDTHTLRFSNGNKSFTIYETAREKEMSSMHSGEVQPVFEILPLEPGTKFYEEKPVTVEPVVIKETEQEKEIVKEKEEVKLFELNTPKSNSNSLAYYEGENLVVDYWLLSDYSEQEQFITLNPKQQEHLRYSLELRENNRWELLQAIEKGFSGKDAFDRFHSYLTEQNIEFNYAARRD